jgi:voltage-gated potassium channel
MVQASESGAIEEVPCSNIPKAFLGKPLRTLMQKNETGANIVGIRRADKSFVVNPLPETIINKEDVLFILGTKRQINRLQKAIEEA